MHKFILFAFLGFSLVACKNNVETTETIAIPEAEEEVVQEGYNTKVPDEEDGGEMLLGNINFKGLQEAPFKEWFDLNAQEHALDTVLVDSLKPLLKNISIKVFMGTWCEDSQHAVPALYEVLTAADYKMRNLDMVAVNHDKVTPDGMEKEYELEFVPTIIFYRDGAEMNRIVEYTIGTMEEDMMDILKERPYKNPYAE